MKICLVSDTLAQMAGTEHSVVMTAVSLAARGHQVTVLAYCSDGKVHAIWKRHMLDAGIKCEEIFPAADVSADESALDAAAEFLTTCQADVLHAIPMESLGQNFASVARQIGCPVVIGTLTSDPSPNNWWYHDLDPDHLRLYDCIICAADILADRFRRYHLDTDRIAVVPHIIRGPRPAAESDHWLLTDDRWQERRSLGAITRLREEKGPDFLLAALSMIVEAQPATTLTIYGELQELQRSRTVATALGIERNVIWHGPFDGLKEIDYVIHRHCIFLLSSLFEGMPISLYEIVARGRLIVATDVGAVGEFHRQTGAARLVRPGDPRAMADTTLELLNSGPDSRSSARDAAQAFYAQFSAVEAVDRLERLYADLLQSRL